MSEPYLDTKVRCLNPDCGATFTMRIEAGDPDFQDATTGAWIQAPNFPCPMCKGPTRHSQRLNNTWVDLPTEPPASEPAPEPAAPEPEPATPQETPNP